MNINGKWYNELNSHMEISVDQNGIITGNYITAVGTASGQYPIIGRVDTGIDIDSQAVGFVVVWQNASGSSDSVTAWSGQAKFINGEEIISTTWLLTAETNEADEWHSTTVSKDIFKRTPPSAAEVEAHINKGGKSSSPSTLK